MWCQQTRRGDRGQATVEVALVLPAVVVCLLCVLQAAVVARDQLRVTHAATVAARAVVVEPTVGAAQAAAEGAVGPDGHMAVTLDGDARRGGMVRVTVTAVPTALPVVGLAVSRLRLRESLVARVE